MRRYDGTSVKERRGLCVPMASHETRAKTEHLNQCTLNIQGEREARGC
jgi:hypothetical protein